MKTKNLTIKDLTSIRKYLSIFSGIFRLTDAELDVLSEIIRHQFKARLQGQSVDPFSPASKRAICERLKVSNPYSINTYIGRLRDKKAVIRTKDGQQIVHPWLMPKGERQIQIDLEWKLNLD